MLAPPTSLTFGQAENAHFFIPLGPDRVDEVDGKEEAAGAEQHPQDPLGPVTAVLSYVTETMQGAATIPGGHDKTSMDANMASLPAANPCVSTCLDSQYSLTMEMHGTSAQQHSSNSRIRIAMAFEGFDRKNGFRFEESFAPWTGGVKNQANGANSTEMG